MAEKGDSYERLCGWLFDLQSTRGIDFGLDRVHASLQQLGDPHKKTPSIHVAGTNGKGSVAAILHSIFSCRGVVTGLYTSPHLLSFRERIRVDNRHISRDDVLRLGELIKKTANPADYLTFFEFTTVMAFLHFAEQRVALGVVETGLGGRLDATNVIDPDLVVITTVALDHQHMLGDSLDKIATEKGGIIKSRTPVLLGRMPSVASEVLKAAADRRGASILEAGRDFELLGEDPPFCFEGFGRVLPDIEIGLDGPYQRDNAELAVAAALTYPGATQLRDDDIRLGLRRARWPGRFHIVEDPMMIVLDGAHNPAGMRALADAIRKRLSTHPIHLIFGAAKDKHWKQMLETILPLVDSVALTGIGNSREEDPTIMLRELPPHVAARVDRDPESALRRVMRETAENDVIVVAGSLFLVAAIYQVLRNEFGYEDLWAGDDSE